MNPHAKIDELEDENAHLVARLAEQAKESSEYLQAKLSAFHETVAELAAERAKNAELAAALSAEWDRTKSLEAIVDNHRVANDELTAELDRLEAGNSSMEKEIPQLRQALRESEAGATALREAVGEYRMARICIERAQIGYNESGTTEHANDLAKASIRLEIAERELNGAQQELAGASMLARMAELEALVAGLEQDRERLMATLESLADAADVFMADQTGATDYRVGLVQPVSVSDCLKLNEGIAKAREAIADAAEIERRKA